MNNHLQILFLDILEKNNLPVLGLYLFLLIAIFITIIKIVNVNYFKELFSIIKLDTNKFDSKNSKYVFSNSSLFLQLSIIILLALGLSILKKEFFGEFSIIKNLLAVSVFYMSQVFSFMIFSSLIGNKGTSFLKNRLSYYEMLSLILFPVILFSFYSPFNLTYLIIAILLALFFLLIVRVSVYLTGLVSVFHIILYLCTSEIIPILFLLKFIFNK